MRDERMRRDDIIETRGNERRDAMGKEMQWQRDAMGDEMIRDFF